MWLSWISDSFRSTSKIYPIPISIVGIGIEIPTKSFGYGGLTDLGG
jgi:hypothetical protein